MMGVDELATYQRTASLHDFEVALKETAEVNGWTTDETRKAVATHQALCSDIGSSINYKVAANIEMKPVNWLWPGRIACGKVSMIAGHPGLGKSQLTASLAAIETTAGKWPVDRTEAKGGKVIILSAEDDAADTIVPRLKAAGADLDKVFILNSVSDTDNDGLPYARCVSLTDDIPRLESLLLEIKGVSLIIVDPITAYMGRTDSHKNAEVRAALAPLSDLAARHNLAVIGISHLNKNGGAEAMLRVMGSLAFVAAARAAYIVAKDPEDPKRRFFLPAKNNLGNDQTGLSFQIETVALDNGIETSRIVWGSDHVTVSADEAISANADSEKSATDEAMDWLSDLLSAGGMKASDVQKQARQAGISDKSLRRAREKLGIKPQKTRFDGGWQWELPPKMPQPAQDAQLAHVEKLGTFAPGGHLGRNGEAREWQYNPPFIDPRVDKE